MNLKFLMVLAAPELEARPQEELVRDRNYVIYIMKKLHKNKQVGWWLNLAGFLNRILLFDHFTSSFLHTNNIK
jgi:hypothetical protein